MAQLYWLVTDLGLTPAQRATLVEKLKLVQLDPNHPQPSHRNHWRVNLAGDAVILEADVDTTNLSAAAIKARLVSIFGVAASTVTYATASTAYGPAVTYKHLGVNKVRLGMFGGPEADWGTSQLAAQAYLKANAVEWEVTP